MAALRCVLMLWVLLAPGCSGRLQVETSRLQVSRGGAVSLTHRHLEVRVEQTAHCKVEAVLNEPVTQRVGRLHPPVFDCSFLEGEVSYDHNGSPLLDQDTVMLRVYRFTDSETEVQTVVLSVSVLEPRPGGLVSVGSSPLVVSDYYGLSNAIDGSVLRVGTRPGSACTIRLTSSETSTPSLGQLVTELDSGQRKGRQTGALCPGNRPCLHDGTRPVPFLKTSCQEFLGLALRYQHLRPPSPEIDYLSLRVEIRDTSTRALLETEAVWLPVLIQGAMQNQPPQASFMSSFILEVDQFILTPLSRAALDASDHETPQERLVFNVTLPPAGGYITHLDDHTKPLGSFTWSDLNDMKVAYQPPNASHVHRRTYEVEFTALDSNYASSPPILVHFSIRTAETKAPRVSWNMGLDLLEGQSRPITWSDLQIVDNDNINAVYLVAVDGPLHGRLSVRGGKAFMFRVGDLKSGVVVYHHDDSDTTRDHIVFRISDGRHSIRHKLPINILPKDDTPPLLINNVALEVEEGGALRLEEYMLLANDLDSSDDYILYTIVSTPSTGQLLKKSSAQHTGVMVSSFHQGELSQGLIYYKHSGDETFEDSFDFTLSDSHQPPNHSQRHTVVVHVFPVKDQLPVEVSGTVRSLTVRETEVVHLSQSHLHFRDREHPDTDLTYVVTQACFSPAQPGLMDAGRLFYADVTNSMKKDPMVPVLKSFTQNAVNHMKVSYMPPIEDIGTEPLFVQFVFSVSDHHGGTLAGLTFNLTVTPVDNLAPEAFSNLLRVEEGGGVLVTEEHLLVRDRDTAPEALRAVVQRGALHGRMEVQGRELRPGDSFTMQDLRQLRVRYIHDDSETVEDTVHLTVTDGHNSAAVVLHVQVLPVNDVPPQLGAGLWAGLSCDEGGRVQVTVDYLSATDADSDDDQLTYMLARAPSRGELQRAGLAVDKFSQRDLLQGTIYYVHTGGEIGADAVWDSVTLIVSDGEAGGTDSCCHGDAPPPPVPLHGTLPVYDLNVTVLPVNNKVPAVTLGSSMLVVDEGSSVCVCGGGGVGGGGEGLLGAMDPDSPAHQLTFYLDTPPLHGYLENTLPAAGSEKSNAGVPVESFTLVHLTLGYINYVQSEHRGAEPTVDQLSVSVSDGLYRSAPVPIYIVINPTNDETPSLHLVNFTVKEGGVRLLTPSLLDASDLDAPADLLTFTVVQPPAHGSLLNGIYGKDLSRYRDMGEQLLHQSLHVHSFTLQELRQGLQIVYLHDDTETQGDRVTVQVTDGLHSVQGTMQITVTPVNDETPRLLRNAGLEVSSLQNRVISSVVLQSEDLDSSSEQLFYILSVTPRYGELSLKARPGWAELSAGQRSDWAELSPGQNFTQDDVDMNRVRYAHAAPAPTAGFKGHDSFRFQLSDGDNRSPTTDTFFISVRVAHKGAIVLVTSPVVLTEGDRVVLTTDVLSATDGSGSADQLLYSVQAAPRHGHVHAAQRPGVPLAAFTQIDVAAHRVCYTHDNSHHAEADSFSFVVTNGDTSRSGTLHFRIEHGDRIPPTLSRNAGLQLLEGAAHTLITPEHLELTDPDTPPANLTFTLTQPPRYGRLLLSDQPLAARQSFTQADVNDLKLAYRHVPGSLGLIDRFYFLPSDRSNAGYLETGQLREEPAVFNIQVERVDRLPPGLTTRRSPSTVVELEGGARYGIFISSAHLQASDPDSPASQLEYSITRPPHFGYLENVLTGSYIQSRFTQADVDQKLVLYVVPSDVDVTSDSFQFRLSDPAGNTMLPETLEVMWSRVELSSSCYRVCENAGTLTITLQRSGKSIDPAYVSIQVEEGSAKVGRDFTHSTANLIQFDPGVNVKTWSVFLEADGLEENHESFSVFLKNPQNALLGHTSSASVEIIDPRGGMCDPEDLMVSEEERTRPLHPPPPPPPRQQKEEEQQELEAEDPITDIEVEVLWESRSQAPPHRPRGDVPDRYNDHGDPALQDQPGSAGHTLSHTHLHPGIPSLATRGGGGTHRVRAGAPQTRVQQSGQKTEERVWTFHSLTSLRLEEEVEPAPQVFPGLQVRLQGAVPDPQVFPGLQVRLQGVGPDPQMFPGLQQEVGGQGFRDQPQMDSPELTRGHPVTRQHKTVQPVVSGCPDGWTHYRRHCYLQGPGVATWGSAQRACSLLSDSNLVSVHSTRDVTWMWKFVGKKPFWIGLSGGPGHWVWSDGRPLTFSQLQQPAPDVRTSSSSCVLVQNPRTWSPKSCSAEAEHPYVCSAAPHTH